MRTALLRRIVLAAAILAGPLALSPAPAGAAVLPTPCGGAVLVSAGASGFNVAPLAFECVDGAFAAAANATTTGTAFSGYYYDSNCSGDISGFAVGTAASPSWEYVGVINNVHCLSSGSTVRSGTFTLSTVGLFGVMTVVR